MPNRRGSGKPKGPGRGQATSNRGRGQGQRGKFADNIKSAITGYTDADDLPVLNFNDMSALSEISNGVVHGSGGRGAGGGRHSVAGPSQPNHRDLHRPFNRGRGRGRGSYTPIPVVIGPPPSTPLRPRPSQNGHSFVRGRGGGLGFVISPERPDPMNRDRPARPLLRPVNFVRAKERLFEADPEELLQAHNLPPLPTDQLDPQTEALAEAFENGEQNTSAIPTVNNSGQETPSSPIEVASSDTPEKESRLAAVSRESTITIEHSAIPAPTTITQKDLLNILLGGSEVDDVGLDPQPINNTEASSSSAQRENDLFWVDTGGQRSKDLSQIPLYNSLDGSVIGEWGKEEPDEVILVPSATVRRAKSMANFQFGSTSAIPEPVVIAPPIVTMENLSLDFTKKEEHTDSPNKSLVSFSIPKAGRSPFVPLRARKEAQRRKRDIGWTNEFGGVFKFKDGREGLRAGDSDLDVGSESSEEELEDNGMEVDEGLDAEAMAKFARGVNQQHMSMNDVAIEEALWAGEFDSSDTEEAGEEATEDVGVEIVFEKEEGEEKSDKDEDEKVEEEEEGDEDDEDWSSEDDEVDMTPTTSFKSRLKRIRERTPAHVDLDEAENAIEDSGRCRADHDEEFLAQMQDLLHNNAAILESRGKGDGKGRKVLFRAIQNDDADHPFAATSSRYMHAKDVPEMLAEQWMRDRNKKAERKRQREQEHMLQGGLGNGKVKGKGRSFDLEEIEEMMRDLLSGSETSFTLPLMDKSIRAKVHAMASVLGLKSKSSGTKNSERKSMTISRGKNYRPRAVDEERMDSVMKRKRGSGKYGAEGYIREGEVIGHKAAKINEGNIGYRMLAQMGWSEGDKLGKEGGLEAPIVAVMKKSKLGLGASWT